MVWRNCPPPRPPSHTQGEIFATRRATHVGCCIRRFWNCTWRITAKLFILKLLLKIMLLLMKKARSLEWYGSKWCWALIQWDCFPNLLSGFHDTKDLGSGGNAAVKFKITGCHKKWSFFFLLYQMNPHSVQTWKVLTVWYPPPPRSVTSYLVEWSVWLILIMNESLASWPPASIKGVRSAKCKRLNSQDQTRCDVVKPGLVFLLLDASRKSSSGVWVGIQIRTAELVEAEFKSFPPPSFSQWN